MHRADFTQWLPTTGLYWPTQQERSEMFCTVIWVTGRFLDRGTETGGTASHTPKGTLHQLFSQGSAAQDSTASEQSLRPVLRRHSSRKDCCFSSEEEWSPWHREPFAPDPTARTQPGRSRLVSAFTALPALASVQVNGVHTAGT